MVNFIIGILNLIIKALGTVLSTLISILPNSPFLILDSINIPFLDSLNWIVPISILISILAYWVGAILIYYGVQVVLRWVKAIQ